MTGLLMLNVSPELKFCLHFDKLRLRQSLQLTAGAFVVWSPMLTSSCCSRTAIQDALYVGFAPDQLAAYDAFSRQRVQPKESAVFLVNLRVLAQLFDEFSERDLACAFVSGLSDKI